MHQVGLILDPRFEEHDTGAGHPEHAGRLQRVRRDLTDSGLKDRCRIVQPTPADDGQLRLVHDPDYIRRVVETCETAPATLDSADTVVCPGSERIARSAVGALIALTRAVVRGELSRGFAALRPPGHHAERDRAMGFCLYNNVAAAARNLTRNEGLARVLIVDWDVHHGNGTQHIFEEASDIFFFSVHQWPLYPGTGAREERGRGAGRGTTLNCPLPPGSGDEPFLSTLRDELAAAAERFRPDFVLVSAGFDAHRRDPLANLEVSTEGFAEATRIVCDLARRFAGGRLVSTLEGGYDLDALGDSVKAHLEVLLEY
jgi:acetoin utilization deacetylase AcuC-like enzyme